MNNSDVETNIDFLSLGISKPFLIASLQYFDFKHATPVQVSCIPKALSGSNLLVQGKNGTGKTLAFSLIVLELIDPNSSDLQVLILSSVREVASQINDFINEMTYSAEVPIYSLLCCGGYSRKDTIKSYKQGVHLVIGTVGRVKDLSQKVISLKSLKLLVLDEADKICTELDFLFQVIPKSCQVLAFSATFTQQAQNFLMGRISNCEVIKSHGDDTKLRALQEYFVQCESSSKAKLLKVLEILNRVPFHQCIIFHNHKCDGSDLANTLRDHGYTTLNISSDLSQEQRIEVIRSLRFLKIKIMLSTDISSRGLDVLNVNLVINFDFPVSKEVYVHRVGRAGRFGTPGIGVTLCLGSEEVKTLESFSEVKSLAMFVKEDYQVRELGEEERQMMADDEGWVDVEDEAIEKRFSVPVSIDMLKKVYCEMCDENRNHCHCAVCRENYVYIKKYIK